MIVPVAALVALGLGTGCAEQTDPVAATVGDQTLSTQELIDEVETIADNQDLALDVAGEMRGSYTQEFVAAVLQRRVMYMIWDQIAADEHVEVGDSARADAAQHWASGNSDFGMAYASFPADYQERLLDEVATAIAVGDELGSSGTEAAIAAVAEDVDIAGRFGTWDAAAFADGDAGVGLPDGPLLRSAEERQADGATPSDGGSGGSPDGAAGSGA
jgi:hypothetical protein